MNKYLSVLIYRFVRLFFIRGGTEERVGVKVIVQWLATLKPYGRIFDWAVRASIFLVRNTFSIEKIFHARNCES